MSNRANDSVLRELDLLAALDSVKARIDTSAIAEIQDWSGAVIGKFYGANVEPPSLAIAGHSTVVSLPSFTHNTAPEGVGYARVTIPQLISICSSTRDEAAWSEFVRRFTPIVSGAIAKYVSRMGNASLNLVDDLVQDTFLKLCANGFQVLESFKTGSAEAFYGFIKAVASNVAQDYFRTAISAKRGGGLGKERELHKGPHSRLNEFAFTTASDSSTVLDRELLVQKIEQQLQAHSQDPNFDRDYKIFWLYYNAGLTARAISHLPEVGLSVKGVESTLLRMTRQIRAELASPASKKKNL